MNSGPKHTRILLMQCPNILDAVIIKNILDARSGHADKFWSPITSELNAIWISNFLLSISFALAYAAYKCFMRKEKEKDLNTFFNWTSIHNWYNFLSGQWVKRSWRQTIFAHLSGLLWIVADAKRKFTKEQREIV